MMMLSKISHPIFSIITQAMIIPTRVKASLRRMTSWRTLSSRAVYRFTLVRILWIRKSRINRLRSRRRMIIKPCTSTSLVCRKPSLQSMSPPRPLSMPSMRKPRRMKINSRLQTQISVYRVSSPLPISEALSTPLKPLIRRFIAIPSL